mmetsp:Transcript_18547/g.49838  ORF Transcript_18547/g.49838 Transcript_18547/m.49838 type:complete len:277 (-) Transcript_18547:66-896(-)
MANQLLRLPQTARQPARCGSGARDAPPEQRGGAPESRCSTDESERELLLEKRLHEQLVSAPSTGVNDSTRWSWADLLPTMGLLALAPETSRGAAARPPGPSTPVRDASRSFGTVKGWARSWGSRRTVCEPVEGRNDVQAVSTVRPMPRRSARGASRPRRCASEGAEDSAESGESSGGSVEPLGVLSLGGAAVLDLLCDCHSRSADGEAQSRESFSLALKCSMPARPTASASPVASWASQVILRMEESMGTRSSSRGGPRPRSAAMPAAALREGRGR